MSNEKFWIEEPCVLFTSFAIVPTSSMTKDEKLNALTRLTILVTIILYVIGYPYWLYFLLIALIVILLLKYVPAGSKEPFTMLSPTTFYTSHAAGCGDQSINISSTGLSSPGTVGSSTHETIVDLPGEMIPDDEEVFDCYETIEPTVLYPKQCPPNTRKCRAYGQSSYHTKTTLLPSNEADINCMNGGSNGARCIVNQLYTTNSLKYRAGLEYDYQRALNRRNKLCNRNCPSFA